jgi:hypothetical protein
MARLRKLYGIEIPPELVSTVTEVSLDEVAAHPETDRKCDVATLRRSDHHPAKSRGGLQALAPKVLAGVNLDRRRGLADLFAS